MTSFLIKRSLAAVVLLVAITFITFSFISINTDRIAYGLLGETATPELVAAKTAELGLDRPFFVQYWDWASNAVRLDLGTAWVFPQRVSETLAPRVSVTLTLLLLTIVLSAVLSVALGLTAAVRGGWADRFVQFLGLIGFAIPSFLIGLFLVSMFAIKWRIFPGIGYVYPSEDIIGWIKTVTLPVLALTLGGVAGVANQVRGSVKDALQADYVRTLVTRGLSPRRILFKHVLRNAGGPALAVLGLQFIGMLGGAVIIESIFAIPGLGNYAVTATDALDIPAVLGLVTITAIMVVIVNLSIDILTGVLNPKVRMS
jgi:peptide/nickel transport system permease protein